MDLDDVAHRALRFVTPLEPRGIHPEDAECRVVPWYRGDWHGRTVQLDPVEMIIPEPDDVSVVLACGNSDDQWDGTSAGICRLRSGVYLAWETFYGPTGDGFNRDAYGGGADMLFSATWEKAWHFGLTDVGRELVVLR